MKLKKRFLLILSVSTAFILCLNIYLLFFYRLPIKRPNANAVQDLTSELNQDTSNEPAAIPSNDIVAKPNEKSKVHEVPIQLDEDMADRLAKFRSSIELLKQKHPDTLILAAPTEEKTVALTFDDGPDNNSTMEILDILNEHNVPATFFFIGQSMDRHSETVKAVISAGHTAANHSWSHKRPTDVSVEALMNEVKRTEDELNKYGASGKLFRPPYGLVTEEQMSALENAGYKVVVWSIDSLDWYIDNSRDVTTCVMDIIHPGAIVLMHSAGGSTIRQATIKALPVIIKTLKEQGYTFVALGQ